MAAANSTESAQAATDPLVERTLSAMKSLDAGQRSMLLDVFTASGDFGWLREPEIEAESQGEIEAESKGEITVSVRLASGNPLLEHQVLQLSDPVSALEKMVAEAHGGSEKILLCSPAGAVLQSSVTIEASGLKSADELLAVVQSMREPIKVRIEEANSQRSMDSDGDAWIFTSATTTISADPIGEEAWDCMRAQNRLRTPWIPEPEPVGTPLPGFKWGVNDKVAYWLSQDKWIGTKVLGHNPDGTYKLESLHGLPRRFKSQAQEKHMKDFPHSGGLPAGWEAAPDPRSGKTCYFNRALDMRQWDAPRCADAEEKRGMWDLAHLKAVLAEEKPRWECDDEELTMEAPAFGCAMRSSKEEAAKLELLLSQAVTAKYYETTKRGQTFFDYFLSAFVEGHFVTLVVKVGNHR